MEGYEILSYTGETLKWLAIAGGSYFAGLNVLAYLSCSPFQDKIKSKTELEQVIREEAEKLGVDAKKITLKFEKGACWINPKGENYELTIELGAMHCTRKTVRHELYHVARDAASLQKYKDASLTRSFFNLEYLFKVEPRALLYGTFGIKI